MIFKAVRVVACLMGAAGVAAATHGGDYRIAAAAQILLVHAAASLALILGFSAFGPRWAAASTIVLMQAGTVVFATDMAMRTFAGHPLLALAAPTAGFALIGAWLCAATLAVLPPRLNRPGHPRAD